MENKLTKSFNSSFLPNSFVDDLFNPMYLFFDGKFYRDHWNEDNKHYSYQLSLPGVPKSEINVSVDNNVITISYESTKEKEKSFMSNSFKKSFMLPENIDISNISAKSEDGILTIKIPKTDIVQTKKVVMIE